MIERMKIGFTPKQYLAELVFFFFALFGLYLIVAWSSYSPIDNAWSVSSYQPESINKAGALGAWLIDLFFTLFGYMGNILPFLCFFVPVYILCSKKAKTLSKLTIFITLISFTFFLLGLSLLAKFALPNSNYYLSGGVLASWLNLVLAPYIGDFGVVLLAVCATIIGFICCSGTLFVGVLVKFYRWLAGKNNEEQTPTQQSSEKNPPITAEPSIKPTENQMVNVANFVKPTITGLDNNAPEHITEQHSEQEEHHSTSQVATPFFAQGGEEISRENIDFHFNTEQDSELPKVSIAENYQEPPLPLNTAFQVVHSSSDLPEMPKVSLVNPVQGDKESQPLAVEQNNASLATDKHNVEVEQANGEPVVTLSHLDEATDKIEPPAYKPYEGSLIHPLLQPTQTNTAKPTTPMPSLDLLERHTVQANQVTREETLQTAQHISQKLQDFGVKATVEDILVGPVVTRYELALQPGVKAAKVTSIDRDLARALSFSSIRVAEVIPGKPYIGIEVPNQRRQVVWLRDVLNSKEFLQSNFLLPMALGKDISGKPIVIDLAKTPHLLVAGSTGSGKSVGINTMILSLLFKVKPESVKFIMIDPKVVELSIYNDIPHLLTPVVTDMNKAANALRWCVEEMERRYQLLSKLYVRNIEGYNEKIDQAAAMNLPIPDPLWKPGDSMDTMPPALEKMSYIVVIVDEFADLMMVAGKQIEELIARLTQKARAVGIHVILATQRPSVDVITGLIKSNIPSRIAFTVVQRNDSRTILDQNGAEALLGRGDMLYLGNGTTDLVRVHGAFMSDEEVRRVADDWRARAKPHYIDAILENSAEDDGNSPMLMDDELDGLFDEVVEFVVSTGTTSTSAIQRRFRVGFNRAARIMDQLEEQGIVSAMQNGKREVLARNSDY
ncbi:S-DNA-T family DNA segregation ATPase FtsK/SpoIIIE [Volucribacter psittacicida]|uniref:DNA translocase FtsK n=1 Tax=Volucribacter psittacicida TaxID=203482 RepID=A0A4R1GB90_9PAST|nr:DNA translocase FtsK [Volucribacter psittacicida]TCK01492.1 S-DNA-T family DNA segregation ATPase FtsK/SpoIIIE [Volucribacter psittacicida]